MPVAAVGTRTAGGAAVPGVCAAGGRLSTGNKNCATSRRARPPKSGSPLTFTSIGYTPGWVNARLLTVVPLSGSDNEKGTD
ncbi:MAG: hypothetical protein M3Y19_00920 [Actinomycetota bacterium]|nr:hypothetical protein [Actinomycetota bacterium]